MGRIPVGLQLYTLREETAKDFMGTLERVAEMGYQAVEFAGYGGIDAKEMRRALDNLGLKAPSSHVGLHLLEKDLQKEIDYALEVGIQYIICPYLNAEEKLSRETFEETMESFARIGEACRSQGIQFGYHNHAFEFERTSDGQYVLDKMFQSVPAEYMTAELDLYWVMKAGLDPAAYFQQYKGRCPLVHVKDMTADERGFFAEVGHGIINYPAIFELAQEVGVQYYIVEQDQCERPPLESVKMSIDYLRSIGIA